MKNNSQAVTVKLATCRHHQLSKNDKCPLVNQLQLRY